MKITTVISLGVCVAVSLRLAQAAAIVVTDDESARAYLQRYLPDPQLNDPRFGQITTNNQLHEAFEVYQRNMGLVVTGTLSDETLEMMNKPRCGMPDMMRAGDDMKRKKRFSLQGSKWDKSGNSPVTYRFKNRTPDLARTVVDTVFKDAFQAWSSATNIEFLEIDTGTPDIEIYFAAGNHGDGARSAFDGPGGTLAHAYFPQFGGNAHFDEDENWTHKKYSGINLFQVVVHEIGHSLGLSHSNVREAIMYAAYLGYQPNFSLAEDDIRGIQALYGRKTGTTTTTTTTRKPITTTTTTTRRPKTTTTTTTTRPDTNTPKPATTTTTTTTQTPPSGDRARFCQHPRFDAITQFGDNTYVFKGDQYAVLGDSGIAPGYPRAIASDWQGLERDIDAALYWEDKIPQRVYLFKGHRYWRYEMDYNGMPTLNYPRNITLGFPGLPNDIDGAFVWPRNDRSYVFKGGVYYRLSRANGVTRGQVDNGYPRNADVWNLPTTYDSVFQYKNGRTYMFKDNAYIRYNDNSLRVDTANPPYPRPIDQWWTNCVTSGNLDTEMKESQDEAERFTLVPQADDNDGDNIDGNDVTTEGYDDWDINAAGSIRQGALTALLSFTGFLFLL